MRSDLVRDLVWQGRPPPLLYVFQARAGGGGTAGASRAFDSNTHPTGLVLMIESIAVEPVTFVAFLNSFAFLKFVINNIAVFDVIVSFSLFVMLYF